MNEISSALRGEAASILAEARDRLNLRGFRGLARQGESNDYRGPGADLRLYIHGAVMEVDGAQCQWQADTVAVFLGGEIEVENAFEIFACDTGAGIGNQNLDETAFFAEGGGEAQGAAVSHRLTGITDDVAQGLRKQGAIDADRSDGQVEIGFDANPGAHDLSGNLGQQIIYLDVGEFELFGAHEAHEGVNGTRETLDFLANGTQALIDGGAAGGI